MTAGVIPNLGLGIGWRPELALLIDRRRDLGFVEVTAENHDPGRPLPVALRALRDRGLRIVPHGVSLSLGGADPLRQSAVDHLARLAEVCDAPLVSEHIAFVRAGGTEIGHLTPVERTRASLDLLIANTRRVQRTVGLPMALENISAFFDWPGAEMDDAEFIAGLLEATGAHLLLDLANVHANAINLGTDAAALLGRLPLDRLAYVHVGGGEERDGVYHDTHAHAVPPAVYGLVAHLASLTRPPGIMLERDGNFVDPGGITRELDAIAAAVRSGTGGRSGRDSGTG